MQAWPAPDLPASMQLTAAGQDIEINGLPVQMHVFTAKTSSQELTQSLRQRLGPQLVTNQLGAQTILGTPIGPQGHYLTIQIYPMGAQSKGIVAISQPVQWREKQADSQIQRQHWQNLLPTETALLSHQTSRDHTVQSEQIIYRNPHSLAYNTQHLVRLLHRQGMVLERMSQPAPTAHLQHVPSTAQLLFFKGPQQSAVATVHDQDRQTYIVLQMDRQPGPRP